MLKGIDPVLNADILYILRAMGHGDDLAIVDANFPAETMATERYVRMEAIDAPGLLHKVLQVLPVDGFVDDPLRRMQVVDDPNAVPAVVEEMEMIAVEELGAATIIHKVERFAFYDQTRQAFAIIATGDTRKYANVLIRKGVISTDPD